MPDPTETPIRRVGGAVVTPNQPAVTPAQPVVNPAQPAGGSSSAAAQPATEKPAEAPAVALAGAATEVKLTPVERQDIVTVGGKIGIFTPLTHQEGAAPDPAAEKNVNLVLTSLQNEIAGLRQENLKLKGQIEQAANQPRSPEDFASAVRHSLDKLQSQLSSMTNPVCNFAVRQFRLETNVRVAVTPLGDIEYRFVPFNERPDPATLSRIVLDVSPVPKQSTAGAFTQDLFKPATAVAQIEGLSADQQAALHQNQIDTVGDLLAAGTRARSSVELTALLKTDRAKLAGWLTNAELLTVKGIDGGRATVLSQAGIDGMSALAALAPEDLVKRFNAQLTKSQRTDVKPIEPAEAAIMIQAAKAYLGQKEQQ